MLRELLETNRTKELRFLVVFSKRFQVMFAYLLEKRLDSRTLIET